MLRARPTGPDARAGARRGLELAECVAAVVVALACAPVTANPIVDHVLPHLPAALVFGPLGPVALAAWLPLAVGAALAAGVVALLPASRRIRLNGFSRLGGEELLPLPWVGWGAGVLMLSSYTPAGIVLCGAAVAGGTARGILVPRRSGLVAFVALAIGWLGLVALHLAIPLRSRAPALIVPLWLGVGAVLGTRVGARRASAESARRARRAAHRLVGWAGALGIAALGGCIVWGLLADPIVFSMAWAAVLVGAAFGGGIRRGSTRAFVVSLIAGAAVGVALAPWRWCAVPLYVVAVGLLLRELRDADRRPARTLPRRLCIACVSGALAATGSAVHATRMAPAIPVHYDVGSVYDLLVDPVERRLYYTLKHARPGESLGWIDLRDGARHTREVETVLERMALAGEPRELLVGGANGVLAVDPVSLERKAVLDPSSNVDFVTQGSDVYVVQEASSSVRRVALGSGAATSIPIGPFDLCSRRPVPQMEWGYVLLGACRWPYSIARDPAGEALFVADFGPSSELSRLDLGTGAVRNRWLGPWSLGSCVGREGKSLFVARPLNRRIDELDARTLETVGSFDVGFGVREIACLPEEGLVAATDFVFGRVWLIDPERRRPTATLRAARLIRSLAYDPLERRLYIGSGAGVHAIDLGASPGTANPLVAGSVLPVPRRS